MNPMSPWRVHVQTHGHACPCMLARLQTPGDPLAQIESHTARRRRAERFWRKDVKKGAHEVFFDSKKGAQSRGHRDSFSSARIASGPSLFFLFGPLRGGLLKTICSYVPNFNNVFNMFKFVKKKKSGGVWKNGRWRGRASTTVL